MSDAGRFSAEQRRIASLEIERDTLRAALAKAETEASNHTYKLESLRDELRNELQERAEAEERAGKAESELKETEAEFDGLNRALGDAIVTRKEHEALRAECERLKAELETSIEETERAVNHVHAVEATLAEREAEIEVLKVRLKLSGEGCVNLKGWLDEARAKLAIARKEALEEAAEVAEDTDIETYGGWENPDDARSTLRNAAAAIRALAASDEKGGGE